MVAEGQEEIRIRAAVLEGTGDWEEAGELYSTLFHEAIREQNIEKIVESARGAARIRWQQGRYDLAEDLATLSWEIAERNGLAQAAARAINLVAVLRYHQEDLIGAKALYNEALERARDVSDDELIGLASMNLGVIISIEGDLREARQLYLESIAAAVRSGDRATSAKVYNNIGTICTWLREWLEAELYFDRGIEIAERLGTKPLLARLLMNRAEPLINFGDLKAASETLQRAERLAGEVGEVEVLANVARFRALIARTCGEYSAADEYLVYGLRLAEDHELEVERADLLESRASLHWEQGQSWEAVTFLDEALSIFRSLNARRDIYRVEQMLSEWTAGDS